jgi:hypothetical protein
MFMMVRVAVMVVRMAVPFAVTASLFLHAHVFYVYPCFAAAFLLVPLLDG